MKNRAWLYFGVAVLMAAAVACTVKYSFTGARIHPDAKTISVYFFPNNATLVSPTLSANFTEALQDKFTKQTRLMLVNNEEGDLHFEGEIINYTETPTAVTGDTNTASRNRVTVTVRVRFRNKLEPELNISDKTFSQYSEYDVTGGKTLMDVQQTIDTEIIEMLVEDIFNAAVSSW